MIRFENYITIDELLNKFKPLEERFSFEIETGYNCIRCRNKKSGHYVQIDSNGNFRTSETYIWKLPENLSELISYLVSSNNLIQLSEDFGFYTNDELKSDLERYIQYLIVKNNNLEKEIEDLQNKLSDHESNYEHTYRGY